MNPYLRTVFTGGDSGSSSERPSTCVIPNLKALAPPTKLIFTPEIHRLALTATPSLDRSTLAVARSLTSVLSTCGASPTSAVLPLIGRAVSSLLSVYGVFTGELRRAALSTAGPPLSLTFSLATEALQCGDGLMAVLCQRGGGEELACVAHCLVGYLALAFELVDTLKERAKASQFLSQLLPFIYVGVSRCLALDDALLASPMPPVAGVGLCFDGALEAHVVEVVEEEEVGEVLLLLCW